MSAYRKRFRVTFDGSQFDVTTSAADYAKAEQAGENVRPMDLTFQMVHAAALRLNVSGIPTSYPAFLERLDDMDDLDELEGHSNGAGEVESTPIPATA